MEGIFDRGYLKVTRLGQEKRVSVFAFVLMLLVLTISYSFILQLKYETPLSEIETDEKAYYVDME